MFFPFPPFFHSCNRFLEGVVDRVWVAHECQVWLLQSGSREELAPPLIPTHNVGLKQKRKTSSVKVRALDANRKMCRATVGGLDQAEGISSMRTEGPQIGTLLKNSSVSTYFSSYTGTPLQRLPLLSPTYTPMDLQIWNAW